MAGADFERMIDLLLQDVIATVGPTFGEFVLHRAAVVRALDVEDPGAKLVDDVQPYLHDTFGNTTWPACPRHVRHPLWYRAGTWWCDQSRAAIAPLGELRSVAAERR